MLNIIERVSDSLSNIRLNLRSSLLGMEWEAANTPNNESAQLWRNLADLVTTDGDRERLQRSIEQGQYETDRLTAQRDALMHTEPDAADLAHDEEMDEWEALNQAVGGDLWDDPDKLAIMRQLDDEMTGADWQDFHEAVVQAVKAPAPAPAEEYAL